MSELRPEDGETVDSPRILVLTNPRILRRTPGMLDALRTHLTGGSRVENIDGPAAMVGRARQAADEGFDRVAVAGGDGTVGLLLRAMMDQPLPIGIIPLGTFNNFARSLGIPISVPDACRVLVEGVPHAVDLGRVLARNPPATFVFKETVGVGVDAMAFAGGIDVAGPGKIPVGALSALSAVLSFRPHPVKFRCHGERHFHRCTQLLVANTPTFAAAFPVLPEARPDDGIFHVLARTWRGRLDLLAELPRILSGRHCDLEHDVALVCQRVYVAGHSNVLLHADGEFFCRMPASVEILPGAARIVVPRPGPA